MTARDEAVEKLKALVRRGEVEAQPPDDEDTLSSGRGHDVESIPTELEDDSP